MVFVHLQDRVVVVSVAVGRTGIRSGRGLPGLVGNPTLGAGRVDSIGSGRCHDNEVRFSTVAAFRMLTINRVPQMMTADWNGLGFEISTVG